MNALTWLQSRTPPVPDALAHRLRHALKNEPVRSDPSASCLDAALSLLEKLLKGDQSARGSAFELLAADALVTYAFEAIADNVSCLEERAATAMLRLAALDPASTGPSA